MRRAALACTVVWAAALSAQTTYRVDCSATDPGTLHSLDAVNNLSLRPGDSLLFRRNTTCPGALQPHGSGNQDHPILIGAYGTGLLPKIVATAQNPAALRLFNQQYIELSSLDISGSSTYGVYISGDTGVLHNITLRNLNVHDVRGPLKHKESGLIVVSPAKPTASFSTLRIENVRAFDTTQWSGIFVSGPSPTLPATDILIRNAAVHDVQGDGIVLFSAKDSTITHSLAWHTGMQHQQSIGTPNAIWTWQCNHCLVEDNEAFLVDSPGVDGGAFDIDWGNTANTVRNNFGHDTVGYCVAIFGANGPTRDSVVDSNLCLHNGLSPRLAQRQGAILLMTWGTGSIEGTTISNNRVDWHPGGDTPVVQTGAQLQATNVVLSGNQFHTAGLQLVDDVLQYTGTKNLYFLEDGSQQDADRIDPVLAAKEPTSATILEPSQNMIHSVWHSQNRWQLTASAPHDAQEFASLLVLLKSIAVQFHHAGLTITLEGDAAQLGAARDALLEEDGVQLKPAAAAEHLLVLTGEEVHRWDTVPSFSELGLLLRNHIGEPNYGRLPTLSVHATD